MERSENGVGDVVNIRVVTLVSSTCEAETTVADSFLNWGPPSAFVKRSAMLSLVGILTGAIIFSETSSRV